MSVQRAHQIQYPLVFLYYKLQGLNQKRFAVLLVDLMNTPTHWQTAHDNNHVQIEVDTKIYRNQVVFDVTKKQSCYSLHKMNK